MLATPIFQVQFPSEGCIMPCGFSLAAGAARTIALLVFLAKMFAAGSKSCSNNSFGYSLIQFRSRLAPAAGHSNEPVSRLSDSLPVSAFVSSDGSNATVRFDHVGRTHSFALVARSVYTADAEVVARTRLGDVKIDHRPIRTFVSRDHGSWVSARLHEDGTVTGLFQAVGDLVRVRPLRDTKAGGAPPAMLQTVSGVAHVISPYRSRMAQLGSGSGGPRIVADGLDVVAIDDVPTADPPHLLYPTELPLPAEDIASDGTNWGGERFYPGCYDGDSKPHTFTVGFTADYEAWRVWGTLLQNTLEEILIEAGFVYEMQMNIRLTLDYLMMYQTESNVPSYAVGCGDLQVDKLHVFRDEKPSRIVGAHHLFTGCGPFSGTVGIATVGAICQNHNVGVTKLRGDGTFDTFAHELGHNFGGHHSFEEGQGQTGGIMDYDGGVVDGVYQFNAKYRRLEICSTLQSAKNSRCLRGEFRETDSSEPASTTTTTTPTLQDGTFVTGSGGDNGCPVGQRELTLSECVEAAAVLGHSWKPSRVRNVARYPRGCYVNNMNHWFNEHPVGTGMSSSRPVCFDPQAVLTSTTTTAPPPPRGGTVPWAMERGGWYVKLQGTNECPPDMQPPDAGQCEAAGRLLMIEWNYWSWQSEADKPRGCWMYGAQMRFNTHPTGAPGSGKYERLVCYDPLGAPPPERAPLPTCTPPADHSRGLGETCYHSDQCPVSAFCCPYKMKCMARSGVTSHGPYAGCDPGCASYDCVKELGCTCSSCPHVGDPALGKMHWLVWANLANSRDARVLSSLNITCDASSSPVLGGRTTTTTTTAGAVDTTRSTSTPGKSTTTWSTSAPGGSVTSRPAGLPKCEVRSDRSRGLCESCIHDGQCAYGFFCCPGMKKCISNSSASCSAPTARCNPRCPSSDCNMNGCSCTGCANAGPSKLYEWPVWANLGDSSTSAPIATCTTDVTPTPTETTTAMVTTVLTTISTTTASTSGYPRCVADGVPLIPVDAAGCPSNPNIASCDAVVVGELCEADGECWTDTNLDNCGAYDVYRKGSVQTTTSLVTTPVPESSTSSSRTTTNPSSSHPTPTSSLSPPPSSTQGMSSTNSPIGPSCADGIVLVAVGSADCPAEADVISMPQCDAVALGELCEADGECSTDTSLNNCGAYDVYRKSTGQPISTTPAQSTSQTVSTIRATAACADGILLTPVAPADCPAYANIAQCDSVSPGELCEGDGECGTDKSLDNCGNYDVYVKGSTTPAQSTSQPVSTTQATAACVDGIILTPVAAADCPAYANIAQCDSVSPGELCEGDGECGTDKSLDNCGNYDVYVKGSVGTTSAPQSSYTSTLVFGTTTTGPPTPVTPTVPTGTSSQASVTPKCADGILLVVVASADCPANPDIAQCDNVANGELCEGDGECGTDRYLDNCGNYDIYLKRAPTQSTTTPPSTPPSARASAQDLNSFHLLNELRGRGHTCPNGQVHQPNPVPLAFDCRLWRASVLHSADMAANDYFDHYSQDGRSPWVRAKAQGIIASGENIAVGMPTAGETLRQWMESDGHCNNMLESSARSVAIGYYAGGRYRNYWTQMFSRDTSGTDSSCIPSVAPAFVETARKSRFRRVPSSMLSTPWAS